MLWCLGQSFKSNTVYSVIRERLAQVQNIYYELIITSEELKIQGTCYFHFCLYPFPLSAYFSLSLCLCCSTVVLLDWWEGRPTTPGLDWPISITITQPSEIAALSKWSPISHQNDTWPWPACSNECEKRDMKGKSKAERRREILYDER